MKLWPDPGSFWEPLIIIALIFLLSPFLVVAFMVWAQAVMTFFGVWPNV